MARERSAGDAGTIPEGETVYPKRWLIKMSAVGLRGPMSMLEPYRARLLQAP